MEKCNSEYMEHDWNEMQFKEAVLNFENVIEQPSFYYQTCKHCGIVKIIKLKL